ncbi:hypothetical protein M427DRAFT_258783 [Gonapodya prolifera JEL478]|uniref:ATP-dependent DNA helicase n=1 Tax=Gonapodya prolifera (strain JEL478) TaxID=1344416 RepID=A0A138ZWY5_GONPJ|nr:hypothetical protein M427DRAFT_258783 [Gonapodya prolifera JEL478]|eukprot:KXS09022.1 hypothetical protein M427DRAFT_258783 [Gonapodya prolifera JEL478]
MQFHRPLYWNVYICALREYGKRSSPTLVRALCRLGFGTGISVPATAITDARNFYTSAIALSHSSRESSPVAYRHRRPTSSSQLPNRVTFEPFNQQFFALKYKKSKEFTEWSRLAFDGHIRWDMDQRKWLLPINAYSDVELAIRDKFPDVKVAISKHLRTHIKARVSDLPKVVPRHPAQPLINESTLSDEQKEVAKTVLNNRKSVFFTGSAGTGKSHLLRYLVEQLQQLHGEEAVAVTATTGIAAVNIGATTIHSFAGIGLGDEEVDTLIKIICSRKGFYRKWINTKVLVVDEVSMMDADLFEKLEAIACRLRRSLEPFGGIQLVMSGDFFRKYLRMRSVFVAKLCRAQLIPYQNFPQLLPSHLSAAKANGSFGSSSNRHVSGIPLFISSISRLCFARRTSSS